MRFDNRTTDAQTDAHAAWLVGLSWFPQVSQTGSGHPGAAVFYLDREPITLSSSSNRDRLAPSRSRCRLERVLNQIAKDHRNLNWINQYGRKVCGNVSPHGHLTRLGLLALTIDEPVQEQGRGHRLQLSAARAKEIAQPLHHVARASGIRRHSLRNIDERESRSASGTLGDVASKAEASA